MLSNWIDDSGVSRGTRISLRRSFKCTSAARWIRLSLEPWTTALSVPARTRANDHAAGQERAAGDGGHEVAVMMVDHAAVTAAGRSQRRLQSLQHVPDRPLHFRGVAGRDAGAGWVRSRSRKRSKLTRTPNSCCSTTRPDGLIVRWTSAAALEQDFEQADGVQHAAGAGDGKHKRMFHFRPTYSVAMPPVKGWRVTVRRPASRIRLANASPEGNSPTLLGR